MYVVPDYCLLHAGVSFDFCWVPKKCQGNASTPRLNVPLKNRNVDIPACSQTIQSNKGLTERNVETERERERAYISAVQCMSSSNKHAPSFPYCVRRPFSSLCKHPLRTPSWLYSDPEQEVISYPTSTSVFLSQVVNVPGS